MTPKEVIEQLEITMKQMDYRQLVDRPEDNHNIKQLLHMMSMTYPKWEETKFKAVEKEMHQLNIKW